MTTNLSVHFNKFKAELDSSAKLLKQVSPLAKADLQSDAPIFSQRLQELALKRFFALIDKAASLKSSEQKQEKERSLLVSMSMLWVAKIAAEPTKLRLLGTNIDLLQKNQKILDTIMQKIIPLFNSLFEFMKTTPRHKKLTAEINVETEFLIPKVKAGLSSAASNVLVPLALALGYSNPINWGDFSDTIQVLINSAHKFSLLCLGNLLNKVGFNFDLSGDKVLQTEMTLVGKLNDESSIWDDFRSEFSKLYADLVSYFQKLSSPIIREACQQGSGVSFKYSSWQNYQYPAKS